MMTVDWAVAINLCDGLRRKAPPKPKSKPAEEAE